MIVKLKDLFTINLRCFGKKSETTINGLQEHKSDWEKENWDIGKSPLPLLLPPSLPLCLTFSQKKINTSIVDELYLIFLVNGFYILHTNISQMLSISFAFLKKKPPYYYKTYIIQARDY